MVLLTAHAEGFNVSCYYDFLFACLKNICLASFTKTCRSFQYFFKFTCLNIPIINSLYLLHITDQRSVNLKLNSLQFMSLKLIYSFQGVIFTFNFLVVSLLLNGIDKHTFSGQLQCALLHLPFLFQIQLVLLQASCFVFLQYVVLFCLVFSA